MDINCGLPNDTYVCEQINCPPYSKLPTLEELVLKQPSAPKPSGIEACSDRFMKLPTHADLLNASYTEYLERQRAYTALDNQQKQPQQQAYWQHLAATTPNGEKYQGLRNRHGRLMAVMKPVNNVFNQQQQQNYQQMQWQRLSQCQHPAAMLQTEKREEKPKRKPYGVFTNAKDLIEYVEYQRQPRKSQREEKDMQQGSSEAGNTTRPFLLRCLPSGNRPRRTRTSAGEMFSY